MPPKTAKKVAAKKAAAPKKAVSKKAPAKKVAAKKVASKKAKAVAPKAAAKKPAVKKSDVYVPLPGAVKEMPKRPTGKKVPMRAMGTPVLEQFPCLCYLHTPNHVLELWRNSPPQSTVGNLLQLKSINAGNSWTGPSNLNGYIANFGPSAAAWSTSHISCVVIGGNNSCWHTYSTDNGNTWLPVPGGSGIWEDIGGTSPNKEQLRSVSICAPAPLKLVIVAEQLNSGILRKKIYDGNNGGWTGWSNL